MSPTGPPKLAVWLLNHFGCSANNDVVMGDLKERFRQGKTSAWYWSQSLIAVIVSAFNEVRLNKRLTFRALLVGWILFSYLHVPAAGVIVKGVLNSYREFEATWQDPIADAAFRCALIGLFISLGAGMGLAIGWIVARLHDRQRAPILLLAIAIPTSFISGNAGGAHSFVFWIGVAALTVGILFAGLSSATVRTQRLE
jgi:uncharacterized membrane protein YhdT